MGLRKLLCIALVLAGGVAGYFMLVAPIVQVVAAERWTSVPCVVTPGAALSGSTDQRQQIHYKYTIGGRDYAGDRYSFSDGVLSAGTGDKQEMASRYPPGREVACYVDPADPTHAVLNRGVTAQMLLGLLPMLMCLVGALGLGVLPAELVPGRMPWLGGERAKPALASPIAPLSLPAPTTAAVPPKVPSRPRGPASRAEVEVRRGFYAALALTALALFDLLMSIFDATAANRGALGLNVLVLAGLTFGYRRRKLACVLGLIAYPLVVVVSALAFRLAPTAPQVMEMALATVTASLPFELWELPLAFARYVFDVAPHSWLVFPIGYYLLAGALRLVARNRRREVAIAAGITGVLLLAVVGSALWVGMGIAPSPAEPMSAEAIQSALEGADQVLWQPACDAAQALDPLPDALLAGVLRVAASNDDNARGSCVAALGGARSAVKQAMPVLVLGCRDPSGFVRLAATNALVRLTPKADAADALSVVAPLVTDPDAQVRRFAINAVRAFGRSAHELLPLLRQALKDPVPDVRESAARALGALQADAAPATGDLVAALADGVPLIRQCAAEALGDVGAEAREAIPALVRAASDPDGAVRDAALRALTDIDPASPQVVTALALALSDPDHDVRKVAVLMLERLGPSAAPAIPALLPLLSQRPIYLRLYAVQALAAIGPGAKAAVPRLRQMLTERPGTNESEASDLPAAVQDALEKIAGS